MALTAEIIAALSAELDQTLHDGKIDKVQQPEKDLILLTIRAVGETRKLLIRASGPNARVHLTMQNYENPKEAPMFCMFLRKHLTGARIQSVTQPDGDRLLVFSLEGRSELGDSTSLLLITELLGRAGNIILVDSDGRILDCLKRISPSEHGGRALLPGLRYELPPKPESFSPLKREEKIGERQSFFNVQESTNDSLISLSAELDARYAAAEHMELQRRRSQELVKSVRRARDRQQRKLALQQEELQKSDNMEKVRQKAELLQANLYRVKKGDRILKCENYFDPECPIIELPLDSLKTPQQNLAAGFKEYRKLKGAREHLTVLTAEGEKQLDYLNSVLEELSRAESTQDLEEIRDELEKTGILSSGNRTSKSLRKKSVKSPKHPAFRMSEPLRFVSPEGLEVLVGRNNLQNDALTLGVARRTDYWLHVKELHGSHVILRCEGQKPSDESLLYAAELAARYSQAAGSGKVAVDYAMVRDVKKPSGALPGKVIYSNYRTVIVIT